MSQAPEPLQVPVSPGSTKALPVPRTYTKGFKPTQRLGYGLDHEMGSESGSRATTHIDHRSPDPGANGQLRPTS